MTPSSLLRARLSLKGVQRTVLSLVRGGLGNDGVRTAENKNVKINSSMNSRCGSIMFAFGGAVGNLFNDTCVSVTSETGGDCD